MYTASRRAVWFDLLTDFRSPVYDSLGGIRSIFEIYEFTGCNLQFTVDPLTSSSSRVVKPEEDVLSQSKLD